MGSADTLMATAEGGTSARLASKLARIAGAIGERDAVRHGNGVKFPYHSAKDVYGWWRPHLEREGIVIVPRVLKHKMKMVELPRAERSGGGFRTAFITELLVEFTVVDGITGETITGSAYGQGEDSSDKGAGKAMTYAEKAFLLGLGMNGAERDNEADAYDDDYERGSRRRDRDDDDRDDNRRDRRDEEHRDETRSVVIGDSNIEGIQRGGRAAKATEVQIKRLREICREKGVRPSGLVELIDKVLGDQVTLPEDGDAGPVILEYLESLSSTDIGKLITEANDIPRDDGWDNDDPGPR